MPEILPNGMVYCRRCECDRPPEHVEPRDCLQILRDEITELKAKLRVVRECDHGNGFMLTKYTPFRGQQFIASTCLACGWIQRRVRPEAAKGQRVAEVVEEVTDRAVENLIAAWMRNV